MIVNEHRLEQMLVRGAGWGRVEVGIFTHCKNCLMIQIEWANDSHVLLLSCHSLISNIYIKTNENTVKVIVMHKKSYVNIWSDCLDKAIKIQWLSICFIDAVHWTISFVYKLKEFVAFSCPCIPGIQFIEHLSKNRCLYPINL